MKKLHIDLNVMKLLHIHNKITYTLKNEKILHIRKK